MLLLTLRPLCLMSLDLPAVPSGGLSPPQVLVQVVSHTGVSLAPLLSVVGHGPPVTLNQLGQSSDLVTDRRACLVPQSPHLQNG